ncbi:MAG: hypothetical protein E4G91_01120 [Candidatus Zixiibacteriota bacterium]|nr:MAG: hypothetical protein E4G91_01120 [candidate division Zixibacteria bacterium]
MKEYAVYVPIVKGIVPAAKVACALLLHLPTHKSPSKKRLIFRPPSVYLTPPRNDAADGGVAARA